MTPGKKVIPLMPSASYQAGQPSPYHDTPPRSKSPDAELSISGQQLRDWARHLADNSSIVNAILSSRVSNGVGSGLSYEPMVRDKKGKLLVPLNDLLRKIHTQWSTKVDVAGELSRKEYERLAWRTWDIDGETFTRQVIRNTKGRVLPYQLQMIDAEWIPHQLIQEYKGLYIVHGVEKDEWGGAVNYYIEPSFYENYYFPGRPLDPGKMRKIKADQINHLKRIRRPNQTRGVTLFHSVIFRIADIAEYQQSHRLAARASADLFASINRAPEWEAPAASETMPDGRRAWDFDRLQIMDELQAGESVNFHTPQHPNQNAVEFVLQELKQIATGCDVGSSQISHVFDASYAAQRLEVVDVFRKTDCARSQFVDDFARPILYEQPIEMARRAGLIPAALLKKADLETLLDCRIQGPTMPVIDPVKDRSAFEKDQQNRWDSRAGIIRQLGRIPAEVDGEIEKDPYAVADEPDKPAEPGKPAEQTEAKPDGEKKA